MDIYVQSSADTQVKMARMNPERKHFSALSLSNLFKPFNNRLMQIQLKLCWDKMRYQDETDIIEDMTELRLCFLETDSN